MASETDFLNGALGQIGAAAITDINAAEPNANWCRIFYPQLRKALFRAHHWKCATRRKSLALDATAPAFEYAFAYNLLTDSLKIQEYNGAVVSVDITDNTWFMHPRFRIEGRQLLSNDSVAMVIETYDNTNVGTWDSLFYQALQLQLASYLIGAIYKDPQRAANKLVEFQNVLPSAVGVDGQEGSPRTTIVDDFIWGR